MTVTVMVRNEVAVGIDRDSSMYLASIAAPPLRARRSPDAGATEAPLPPPPLSTSALVIRPRGPEPATLARSIPSAAATRAATGVALASPLAGGAAAGVAAPLPELAGSAGALLAAVP